MLTRPEINMLIKVRERIQKIESRLEWDDDHDYQMGRLAEACRTADEAVLHVLIVAHVAKLGVTDIDLFGHPLVSP